MLYAHYFIESLQWPHKTGTTAPLYRVRILEPAKHVLSSTLRHYTTQAPEEKVMIISLFVKSRN